MLNALRTSEISYLDLSTSMGDEDGLNLDSQELLHGRTKYQASFELTYYEISFRQAKQLRVPSGNQPEQFRISRIRPHTASPPASSDTTLVG